MVIIVFHDTVSGGQPVDNLFLDVTMNGTRQAQVFTGENGLVTFTGMIAAQCLPNFFGVDCNTFCPDPTDDCRKYYFKTV